MARESEKVKLLLAVLGLQLCLAGFQIVSRAALDMGISQLLLCWPPLPTSWRSIDPIFPLKDRPPLSLSLLAQFFLLAFCGITATQGFYLLGLYYLSPTYASAIQNTIPAITFAMAAALRLEQVHMNKRYGLAKVIGTIVSIGGATIITLYKGHPFLHRQPQPNLAAISSSKPIVNWTLGCVFILGNCLAWSGYLVLLVPVLKKYPARLSSITLVCIFGLVQVLAIAAFLEKDIERWKIHSQGELFTILYAGLVASGLVLSLQIWCIDRGGPLFTAVFQPVQTAAVAIMAAIILGEQLYSGGIIGSILIVIGLYFVLWGKNKENEVASQERDEDLARHLLN